MIGIIRGIDLCILLAQHFLDFRQQIIDRGTGAKSHADGQAIVKNAGDQCQFMFHDRLPLYD